MPNQCRLVIELAVGTERGQLSAQRRVVRQREAREAIGYYDAPTQPWCSSRPAWLPPNHLRPEAMVTHVFISHIATETSLSAPVSLHVQPSIGVQAVRGRYGAALVVDAHLTTAVGPLCAEPKLFHTMAHWLLEPER